MTLFTPAVKEQLKARVAIDGPTGSGKTWTALQWARILAGPDGNIGLIDTENRSAAYYAPTPGDTIERLNPWDPPYEFGHAPVTPPYSPVQLRQMIVAAGDQLGDNGVLVIDSLTHFWNGEGGTLDIVDNASSRGNSFTGWKEGTPAQRAMLDAIIHAPCHVIVTMRSKMEYILVEQTKNGRTTSVPTKVGMAPEQRAGVEYEFTVVADMDLEHRLTISKSRCDQIADVVAPNGRSAEPAIKFAEWLGSGVERPSVAERDRLIGLINEHVQDEQVRTVLKRSVLDRFGRPVDWLIDQLEEIETFIISQLDTVIEAETEAAVNS
jgi:AAA domain